MPPSHMCFVYNAWPSFRSGTRIDQTAQGRYKSDGGLRKAATAERGGGAAIGLLLPIALYVAKAKGIF